MLNVVITTHTVTKKTNISFMTIPNFYLYINKIIRFME